jgi:alginate O-acetyltransferase complex protein AlgI
MLFNSAVYIFLFLPLVVALYFILNRLGMSSAAKIWLVLASLFFYGYWELRYIWLIVVSIGVNFLVAQAIQRPGSVSGHETGMKRRRRLLLYVGIGFNICLLGYFKYADFFIDNVNLLFGSRLALLQLVLPLAISFFTFQQVAYLVDCYRGKAKEYDFLNYCLFVTFFPQLISGPIVHHSEMMPQFSDNQRWKLDWHNVSMGAFVFSIGLFKKVFIADSFSVWVNAGFDDPVALSFFCAWGTALSYSLQIYYDFSGYTDMAIGAALMFNIRLPVNFNSPYKAQNIQEFWRRWHVTLSRWLRDYIYIPLGGNRYGFARSMVFVAITFLIGGLWHGAAWTFLIWGAIHGFAMIVMRIWRSLGLQMHSFFGWALTITLVTVALVFFRASDTDQAIIVVRAMSGLNGFTISADFMNWIAINGLDPRSWLSHVLPGTPASSFKNLVYLLIFWGVVLIPPNSMQMVGFVHYSGLMSFRANYRLAVFTGIIFGIAVIQLFTDQNPTEFLYYQF